MLNIHKVDTVKIVDGEDCVVEEQLSEIKKLMKQVNEAGTAGFISYAL